MKCLYNFIITACLIFATCINVSGEGQESAKNNYTVKDGVLRFEEGTTEITGVFPDFNDEWAETITEIVLPSSLKKIHCRLGIFVNLAEINIPDGVEEIGYRAFANTKIKSIVIPEGVEEIEWSTFFDCQDLERVHLPSTLKRIGHGAFSGCGKLSQINISEEIDEIDSDAFEGCLKLPGKVGVCHHGEDCFGWIGDTANITTLTIPEGVTTIQSNSFHGFNRIKEIQLPSTLQIIESFAFSDNQSLEEVVLPEGLHTMGEYIFGDCASLRKVTIPSTLKIIPYEAFAWCSSLEEVIIPEGVEEIEKLAFIGCSSLQKMHLPSTMLWVGEYAFAECGQPFKLIKSDHTFVHRNAFGESFVTKLSEMLPIICFFVVLVVVWGLLTLIFHNRHILKRSLLYATLVVIGVGLALVVLGIILFCAFYHY